MIVCILDNGKKVDEVDEVYKYGEMEVFMKDIGEMIKRMEKEDLYLKMVMYIKENISIILYKVMEYSIIIMEISIMDIV